MYKITDIDYLDIEEVIDYVNHVGLSLDVNDNPYEIRLSMMVELLEQSRILFDDTSVVNNNYFKSIYLMNIKDLYTECSIYISDDTLNKLNRLHMISLLLFIADIKITRYCSLSSYFEYVYNKLTLDDLNNILKFVKSHNQAISLSEAISRYDDTNKFILVFDILNSNDLINTKLLQYCINNNYIDIVRYIYENGSYRGYVPVWLSKSLEMYNILIQMSNDDIDEILYEIVYENNYDLLNDLIFNGAINISDNLMDEIDTINNKTADLARSVYYNDV